MLDRILGVVAFAALVGFLGVLIGFVQHLDLAIVIAVTLALVAYDFLYFEGGKER